MKLSEYLDNRVNAVLVREDGSRCLTAHALPEDAALELTAAMWTYLAKHGCTKSDVTSEDNEHYNKRLAFMAAFTNKCAACEYGSPGMTAATEFACDHCPVWSGENECCEDDGERYMGVEYEKWCDARDRGDMRYTKYWAAKIRDRAYAAIDGAVV